MKFKQIHDHVISFICTHRYKNQLLVTFICLSLFILVYALYNSYQLSVLSQGIAEAKAMMQQYTESSQSSITNSSLSGAISGVTGQAINNITQIAMQNMMDKALTAQMWQIIKVALSFIIAIPTSYLSFSCYKQMSNRS